MTYALSAALQGAVYQCLVADEALDALVGGAIHDALPPGIPPALYVLIGPEEVRAMGDSTGTGAQHDFTIAVVSEAAGFATAKQAAAAVCAALEGADLSLSGGRVVGLWFRQARARRVEEGTLREILLTFRARVDLDLSPITIP